LPKKSNKSAGIGPKNKIFPVPSLLIAPEQGKPALKIGHFKQTQPRSRFDAGAAAQAPAP